MALGQEQQVPPAGASARVSVPASSANLGAGYDCVGLALGLRDDYVLTVTDRPGLVVDNSGEGADRLSRGEDHLVARALRVGWESCGLPWLDGLAQHGRGLRLRCDNAIPMSAGLGSSAAALVGGLGLAHALVRDGALTDDDRTLVNTQAGLLEGHPDNASASVYGGMTLSWLPSERAVRSVRLEVHEDIEPVVLVPEGERLSTRTARQVLPPHVPHSEAVRQAGRAALLVHAMTVDPSLLLDATQDWLHQEYRRRAYPTTMAAVDGLRAQGHAAVVSGAGPTVLVLARAAWAEQVVDEVRGWGPGWRSLRPGVARDGLTVRPVPSAV
ncbi:homoserine kinase [Ornithinicoccus halotolerans]|uniref:homoserine kinase n=1 Tax=Ornithinicoccus halotolerans TaxID=1748220 RepID=UPI001E3FB479|nr:homoserine kinase [Ornithinicoccus halotolerans]